jgi:Tol biopolymer transport system component
MKSDIVLYDIGKREMMIPPGLSRDDKFETFPCFSPDGKKLYYCSADSLRMPAGYDSIRYSLCSVSFDEKTGEFSSETDTLISSSATGKSISIPRVSPDGKFLMFNVTDFGAFPSYNPEADIWLMVLENRKYYPLDSLNSKEVDSYHSWSSNSRWTVFTSRRMNGLFSNLYIAYIDERGIAGKPFLLPQKNPDFYSRFLLSFNVPEFAIKPIAIGPYKIEKAVKSFPSFQVQSGSSH